MRNWIKQLIGLNAKLAVLSDLVSGYGENCFSAGVLLWGLTFSGMKKCGSGRICDRWGAYHASANVICFESYILYSSGVILCCVRGSFPRRSAPATVYQALYFDSTAMFTVCIHGLGTTVKIPSCFCKASSVMGKFIPTFNVWVNLRFSAEIKAIRKISWVIRV